MPTAYVLRRDDDGPFVQEWVLPPLAALGFDRALIASTSSNTPLEIEHCAVAVIVMGDAAGFAELGQGVEVALRARTPVISMYRGMPEVPSTIVRELSTAAGIDVCSMARPTDLWRRMARLLPPPDAAPAGDVSAGEPLIWDEHAFSVLLDESVARNDFALGAALVERFERHLPQRATPYPGASANTDLSCLQAVRQFVLMRRYAAAAIASGTSDVEVRRRFAQALIESGEFDEAVGVLEPLIRDAPLGHTENYEARGLLGRAYKQRYINAGSRAEPGWLTTAIATYWSAFKEDNDNLWHGINAASCLLRAARDGVVTPPADPPDRIAHRVLEILDDRQQAAEDGRLAVWDYATRMEAHVDLGNFSEGLKSLSEYLTHPDMTPFEVSSTYRQFDEVLQLRERADGRPILDQLLESTTRLRAGGRIGTANAEFKRFLVRVADADWVPRDVPDLVVGSRLGTVVSISGSAHTIETLLRDPLVISIEESRPAARPDAASSLSFVRVQETYQWDDGPFSENGAGALVAIIDDGIDVLHEAFLGGDGSSRIIGIWDQTDPDPDPSSSVGSGRLHTADDVARYVRECRVPARLSRRGRHGTHVASIAAGRRCGMFGGGLAHGARLLVVIPSASAPTGYSTAHLDALSFIDRVATSLDLPVVVNVSQGMNAGAHDGKSALEVGFDTFCENGRKPGRVVVKSAGNERIKRGHAKLTVPPGGADDLVWRCMPGRSRAVNLELWWNSANEYRFQLRSPAGESSARVDRRHPAVEGHFTGQGQYRLEMVPSHIDNGDKLLRIRLTCGNSMRAEANRWTLAIEAARVRCAGDIHAWVERDNGPLTEFISHDSEEMTVSVPGTADSVITVGAVEPGIPVRVGEFSSFGPTRDGREKPDLCAPGVAVHAALHSSGNGVIPMDGTSMAAPHVTGAIALLLSKATASGAPIPTASQIRAVLTQTTMFKNAYWDRGQGFGVLDVKALLEEGLPTLV
jgi:subtilisin family serine protease/tetratricopeptide (TPR) repeat protein